jgi:hypothetical protein
MTSITINVTYDSSVTALKTSDPTLYTDYTTAIQTAVQYYESIITNPITVNISFGWGEVDNTPIGSGDAGESRTLLDLFSYSQIYNAVTTHETTSAVQRAAVASLPATDPTNGATFVISTSEAAALGLTTIGAIGGSVGLSSSVNFAWTQSVGSSQVYAVGTLEHEISEVLGRLDQAGNRGEYSLLDMFRYTAANGLATDPIGAAAGARDEPFVAGYNANAPSYFSYNGTTVGLLYETPSDVASGADVADWAPSVNHDAYADGQEGVVDTVSTTDLQELNVLGYDLVCYGRGTRIATPDGETAIEALRPGDLVLTWLNGQTVPRPVKWIGYRRIGLAAHPRPDTVAPIRIRGGAFADNMPRRDLLVSPSHAIFVDGKLVCARQLVNESTIQRAPDLTEVEYFHIELDSHAILLAEGLRAESYLETGNRGFFANSDHPLILHPDLITPADFPTRESGSCVPFVTQEADVRPIWQRLAQRAAQLGQSIVPLHTTADPALHLITNDQVVQPLSVQDGLYRFLLPKGATEVRLASRAAAPVDVQPWLTDQRRLGVAVIRITLLGANALKDVPLDHPSLSQGWWALERDGVTMRRWTNGNAVLPLLAAQDTRFLTIKVANAELEYLLLTDQERRAA